MSVVSYEDRVAKMHKPGDEDEQLRIALSYAKTLRNKAKRAGLLSEKIELGKEAKQAEEVVRTLRLNIFDLQDMREG